MTNSIKRMEAIRVLCIEADNFLRKVDEKLGDLGVLGSESPRTNAREASVNIGEVLSWTTDPRAKS